MTRLNVMTGAAALAVGVGAGVMLAQAPPSVPYFVGNALGLPVEPTTAGTFARDVAQRQGVRRDLLGRELLVRSGPQPDRRAQSRRSPERADQQRVGVAAQPRRFGAHGTLDRRAEHGRAPRRADATARAQRAVRQRHRRRHALPGRSRRQHERRRQGRGRDPPLHAGDGTAGRRDARAGRRVVQRHRGGKGRHGLRDPDRRHDGR